MKLKIVMAVLALFVFAGATGLAADQDKKTTHKKTRTLTGCLAKSDDAKEFNLVTGKGGTWEIKSDSVDLAPHVGHTVTRYRSGLQCRDARHERRRQGRSKRAWHGQESHRARPPDGYRREDGER